MEQSAAADGTESNGFIVKEHIAVMQSYNRSQDRVVTFELLLSL
jgi:hypothetical protein